MTAVLDAYKNDPVGFVEQVLGHPPPYDKQREILRTVAGERRTSVVGANGSGKDWAAARTILWWLATRRQAIAVATGPTQRQVEQIVWREMRAAYKASSVDLGGRLSGSQWNIADDRYAIGFSTNKADNLQGFHSPELLVVVTEAHAMPQDQMEALKRLYPARMLLTGNAFSRDGEFFESHHTKRHIYTGVTISVYDTPNFTGENGGAPGMPTEEDVEERKLDWGEDHPLYQGSILAKFPDMLDDSLISRSAIEAAVARWEGQVPSPSTGEGEDGGDGAPVTSAELVVPAEAGTSHPWGDGDPETSAELVVPAEAGTSHPWGDGDPETSAELVVPAEAGTSPPMTRGTAPVVPAEAGTSHPWGEGAPVETSVELVVPAEAGTSPPMTRGTAPVVPAEAGTSQPMTRGAASVVPAQAGTSPPMTRGTASVVPAEAGTSHPTPDDRERDSRLRWNDDPPPTPLPLGGVSALKCVGEGPETSVELVVPAEAGTSHPMTRGAAPVVPAEAGTSHPMTRGAASVVPAEAGTSHPMTPGTAPTPPPSGEPRLGVDVARFGSDMTALCVRRGWRVESLRSFSHVDTMRTAGEAAALVRDHHIPAVFVDEGGLGAGVVDRLRELEAPVHGVQFGGKARQSGRFANMRAELFWELRRLFNDNLIAIPRDEELISQLLGLRYDVTSAGQVKMESKSSLRKRGLRSPDKADALALAFMEPPSLRIWTGPPDEPPRQPGPVRDSTSWSTFPETLRNRLGVW